MIPVNMGQKAGRYGTNKRVRINGENWDSMGEYKRWGQLKWRELAGEISDLKRQVPFVLAPSVKFAGATRARPAIVYRADFTYQEGGALVVEDFKGNIITPVFTVKRHLLKAFHNIDVKVTRG